MRHFSEVYKTKMQEAEAFQENKVLGDFRQIYEAMIKTYGILSVHELDEPTKLSFLTELNHYWDDENGLNEKGERYIVKSSMTLNENSTVVQKKNFLKTKVTVIVNEVIRQSNLKTKLYDTLDEMYKSVKAKNLSDVLPPESITKIFNEAINESVTVFVRDVNKELSNNTEPRKKYIIKVKK